MLVIDQHVCGVITEVAWTQEQLRAHVQALQHHAVAGADRQPAIKA